MFDRLSLKKGKLIVEGFVKNACFIYGSSCIPSTDHFFHSVGIHLIINDANERLGVAEALFDQ